MELTVKINMDNAAFGENGEDRGELERILNRLAASVVNGNYGNIFDVNGNKVGT